MNPRNVVVEVPQGLDRLVALARQVAGYNPNGQSPPPAEMAQRLVTYLRDNPEFSYSLSASITDPNIDPIEDFLFNRKAGHCEYYASALALMLRSVEIPSRLVNGFKGGDQNGPDEPFEVQERHAHAWVEAFIDGRWLVFDPTPASREESVESLAPPVSTWRDIFDRIQGIWSTLVNMNLQQQQDLLYEPLGDAAAATWQSARTGKRGIAHMFARLTAFLGSPARWGTWQGGLAGLALVVVVAGAVWLAVRYRRIWAVLWAKLMSRPTSSASIVEFYERFRKLCKTRGLVRRPGETQQEFADVVGRSLGGILQPAGLGGFPADLSRAFYQVRFGSRDLSPDELAHIQNQLDSLEAALANGNGRRRPSQPTFSVRPAG